MYINDNLSIKRNNVSIEEINGIYKIKPKRLGEPCIITLYSDHTITCQLNFNTKLIKNIIYEYQDHIFKLNKIPFKGVLLNCQLNSEIKLKITIEYIDLCSEFNIYNLSIKKNKHFTKVEWDKILIINLPRRTDRKASMIAKLKEQGITNYEFIEGIDGTNNSVIKFFNKLKHNSETQIINSGHFACLLSHIKSIEKAKADKLNQVLILEDDIIFDNKFISKINKIKVPDYDILYLGGLILELKFFLNGWATHNEIMGAYSYLVKSHMYDKILFEWKKLIYCSDICLISKIQSKYNVVLLNDLIKTTIIDTDTSSKNKIMENMINNLEHNLFDKIIDNKIKILSNNISNSHQMNISFNKKKSNVIII